MYIKNGKTTSKITGTTLGAEPRFTGVTGLELPLSGIIMLCSDSDFVLREIDTAGYARQTLEDGVLRLTNAEEPAEPTAEELLEQARTETLERIKGRCSGAIYRGIDYGGKHYSLDAQAQGNLTNAMTQIQAGATSVPFAADGEELSSFMAAQITAISSKANAWGTVNICYYAKLKEWIAAETDTAVLEGVEYGAVLPTAYMTALATQLAGFGINITDWVAL